MSVQHGCNEIRWRPEQETSLAPLCSSLRFFGSKCTVLKTVLVTLLGLFGARGIVPSLPPVVTPWCSVMLLLCSRSGNVVILNVLRQTGINTLSFLPVFYAVFVVFLTAQ